MEPSRAPWIHGPRVDSLFVLAAPVLTVCILVPLSWWIPSQAIWVAVMAFGSVGHHLPGFLRTYGDRSLFDRFRARFIVAPIAVFGAAWWCAGHQLHAMLLVSLVWSIWHGMMQHYGFMRIYDAKAGITSRLTARLDWWMTCSWFLLCLAWSPEQAGSVLDGLHDVGLTPLEPALVRWLGLGAVALAAAVTTAYLAHLVRTRRRGERISPHKLVLLASTAGLLWFARVVTTDPFLSVALFEVLHDVQYLAIVWAFNRRQVDGGLGGSRIADLVFRPGAIAGAIYVGLCLVWGSLGWVGAHWDGEGGGPPRVLTALLMTSGILHFYYDGFIWKVRQRGVRAGLAVSVDGARPDTRATALRDLVHLLAFGAVLGVLYTVETRPRASDELAVAEAMAASVPRSPTAHRNLAAQLSAHGRVDQARTHLERAIELAPRVVATRVALAWLLIEPDPTAAIEQARHALGIDPHSIEALGVLGLAQIRTEQLPEAIATLRRVTDHGDASTRVLNNLGWALARTGDHIEAQRFLRRAIDADPSHVGARLNLGLSYGAQGRWSDAAQAFEVLVGLAPESADALNNLGAAHLHLGRREDAATAFRKALAVDPDFIPARRNLAALMRSRPEPVSPAATRAPGEPGL